MIVSFAGRTLISSFNIVGIKLLSENPLKILCIQNYIEFELYGTQLSET